MIHRFKKDLCGDELSAEVFFARMAAINRKHSGILVLHFSDI